MFLPCFGSSQAAKYRSRSDERLEMITVLLWDARHQQHTEVSKDNTVNPTNPRDRVELFGKRHSNSHSLLLILLLVVVVVLLLLVLIIIIMSEQRR